MGLPGEKDLNFPGHLITIDKKTGEGTIVGDLLPTFDPAPDITFTSDGTLFGWSKATDDLVKIDLSSGSATSVGVSGLITFGDGLAASPSDVLFFAGDFDDGNLYTVDRTDGIPTLRATLNGIDHHTINALTFNGSGLYGAHRLSAFGGAGPQAMELITINTTTGAITSVGTSVDNLSAIAFGN